MKPSESTFSAMASAPNDQDDKPSTSTPSTDQLKKLQDQMAKYKVLQRQPYSIDDKDDFPPQFVRRINNDLNEFITDPAPDIFLVPDTENILRFDQQELMQIYMLIAHN